jgi:hypothetical protein
MTNSKSTVVKEPVKTSQDKGNPKTIEPSADPPAGQPSSHNEMIGEKSGIGEHQQPPPYNSAAAEIKSSAHTASSPPNLSAKTITTITTNPVEIDSKEESEGKSMAFRVEKELETLAAEGRVEKRRFDENVMSQTSTESSTDLFAREEARVDRYQAAVGLLKSDPETYCLFRKF